jgi:hypothetical protein
MLGLRFVWRAWPQDGNFEMRILNAAAIGFCFLSSAAFAGVPEGTWLSEDGGTKVRI